VAHVLKAHSGSGNCAQDHKSNLKVTFVSLVSRCTVCMPYVHSTAFGKSFRKKELFTFDGKTGAFFSEN
jgi:hypothetical protein